MSAVDANDYLARMAQNDRVTLATICKTLATDGTNIDPKGVNLGDLLFCLDLKCPKSFSFDVEVDKLPVWKFDVDIDDDGRIISLEIYSEDDIDDLYDLPVSIGCLGELKSLYVDDCKSLPYRALSKLPHLEFLWLFDCSQSLYNFPLEMRLPHLKCLEIYDACVALLPLIQRIRGQLPSLEFLSLADTKFISFTFHHFTDTVGCQKTLNRIEMIQCDIDESQLETLMFDVMPNFPLVYSLDLSGNNIRSFRSIVQRLDNSNDSRLVYKSALYNLDLTHNPIETCLSHDSEENANICQFLRASSTIGILGCDYSGRRYINRELALNRAGRRLIVGRGSDRSIPLSVWPTVLGRRKMVDTTGLFYMLRNGPVLLDRSK